MELPDELARVAREVGAHAEAGAAVAGVVPVESAAGQRLYLCALAAGDGGGPGWLVVDAALVPVTDRRRVRDAASIAVLCELAEETAAGGDLDELLAQLAALRLTENPSGIDEAEGAVLALQAVIGAPPQVATPSRLDRIGAATRRLEAALGDGGSPFTEAMKHAGESVQAFVADVERRYRLPLDG